LVTTARRIVVGYDRNVVTAIDYRPSIVSLVRERRLDADLAALLWLLGEGGVPMTVGSLEADDERTAVAAALDDLVPPSGPRPIAVRAGSLADVLTRMTRKTLPLLGGAPAPAPGPRTGVVIIMEGGRVVAAHLVRPPLRDAAGHVQKPGPAVLATYDARVDTWDHFAWGIAPELAELAGVRAGDVEPELARRAEYLSGLARSGIDRPDEVGSALHGYHHGAGSV
jgi:hypothetical protein